MVAIRLVNQQLKLASAQTQTQYTPKPCWSFGKELTSTKEIKTMKAKHIIHQILRKVQGLFNTKHKNTRYKIGNYEIEIPPHFALPGFQKSFKLYDHFLPILAKNLNREGLIIDVGANIGDTAIAMIQYCKNPMICIEASDTIYPYLEKNLKSIGSEYLSRVKTCKALVGTGSIKGILHHTKGGTAGLRIIADANTITHVALDNIIEDVSDVLLLKVDTDGYDFDVIKSAEQVLTHSEPILFWENEISEDFQYIGFNNLYDLLEEKGYKHIYIFDNFGNIMIEESNFETLRNINSYIYSMKKYNCTRTIYYTDILASTEKNSICIRKAIDEFKTKWINKQ